MRVQARRAVASLRDQIAAGDASPATVEHAITTLPRHIAATLRGHLGGLRRVLNATGIFIHTNLGRSPLPATAVAGIRPLLESYCDLEIDLATGRRGERNRNVERLMTALTGAEAAITVNNNAGALVLALATLARGREVVVSRGELVEIGGSFRIPEILEAAGARLVEVGSTNRTRREDYARAIGPETALLLKVHPSNYRIRGFVAAVEPGALAELGREHGIPVLVDEGSGLVRDSDRPQLSDHPSFEQLIVAGCDLVCGSGDKLLGGPQAGLLVGRREWIRPCRRHPLYRALRPDRFTFAALEIVLRLHLAGDPLPLDRLWQDGGEHRRRLERVAAAIGADVASADAFVGGGAAPDQPIPGEALALEGDEGLLARLRQGMRGSEGTTDPEELPPVVGYLREGRVWLDLRTVDPRDDDLLIRAVGAAQAAPGGEGP